MPLTAMQRDLYLSSLRNPETLENSLGYAVELHHKVDVTLWHEELTRFSNSQSILRSDVIQCLSPVADAAYLCVAHPVDVALDVIDLSVQRADSSVAQISLNTRIEQLIRRPYYFEGKSRSSLVNYHLIKLSDEHWVAILATHHLVMDGVAYAQQLLTVVDNYQKRYKDIACTELTVKPDLFSDYVEYDRQQVDSQNTVAYWRDQLAAVEPLDYNVQYPVNKKIRKHLALTSKHWEGIRQYCRQLKITPTLYFKSIYGLMVNHYCRQAYVADNSDFLISEFGAGRPKGHSDGVGCYYLVYPFVCKQEQYRETSKVEDLFLAARDQQKSHRGKLRLSVLQQGQLTTQGRLGFMYNYIHFYPTLNVMGVDEDIQQLIPDADSQVQFAVKLIGADLNMYLDYQGDQFEEVGFLDRFESISQQVINGTQKVGELLLVDSKEADLLETWSSGSRVTVQNRYVQYPFELQCHKSPKLPAIIYGDEVVSYQQLNEQANKIANCLLENDVKSGEAVGICVVPSPNWIASVLGIVKAGAQYVPIDSNYPVARVKDILDDSNVKVLLTDLCTNSRLSAVLDAQQKLVLLDDETLTHCSSELDASEPAGSSFDEVLYTIYTSGSTGKPKGASVTHGNEENLLSWYTEEYDITAESQHLIISSPGFDLTQKNVFAPLRVGGTIVLPKMEEYDPKAIADVLKDNAITHVNCAPSAFYGLLDDGSVDLKDLISLHYVLFGGEPIQLSRLTEWINRDDCQSRIVNMYGPTECTDIATAYTIEDPKDFAAKLASSGGDIPIGTPNNNVTLHVLDQFLAPVIPGNIGELCISGDSVGTGYLNRDELNKTAFVEYQGQRTYRTGDLVRYNQAGLLVYVGRNDFQIKLRGLRIELDEISYGLKQLDGVRDGLALVDDDRLLGFAIAAKVDNILDNYRAQLGDYLPAYMIPSSLTLLDEWPLNTNGKVDRRRLLALASANTHVYVAPETDIERAVAAIWSEVLNVSSISRDANFFDLGGHSLLATQIVSRIRDRFSIDLPLRELFKEPTLANLSATISRLLDEGYLVAPPIKSVSRELTIPLSFAQQRMWFLAQLDTQNTAYNLPAALRLTGSLDVEALRKSFETIIQRHEILRTSFTETDGNAQQIIHQVDRWELPVDELSVIEGKTLSDDEKEAEAIREANHDRAHYFPLTEWPLLKTRVLKLSETDHVLLANMHHIVSDGWSIGVFIHELSRLYQAYTQNQPNPFEPLAVQYGDYAHWQRQWLQGEVLDRQIAYWTTQLQGAPDLLRLPTDRPRPPVQTFNGRQTNYAFSTDLAEGIKALGLEQEASPFMIMLAGYQLMLGKYAQMDDVCVGVPVAGRGREELEPLIGFFVNAVVIRTQLNDNPSVTRLIEQVKQTTLDAFAHQDVPAELILEALDIERHLDHAPLAQVGFAYQHQVTDTVDELAGNLQVEIIRTEQATAKYDLTLYVSETDDGYGCTLEYNTDLFNQETVDQLLRHYENVLTAMVHNPEQATQHLPITTDDELATLLDLESDKYEAVLPLTAMQRDLYLSSLRNPDTQENSMGYSIGIHHQLDVDLWVEELTRFANSQSVLRAEMVLSSASYTDVAYQCIRKPGPISIDIVDLTEKSPSEEELQLMVEKLIRRPYSFGHELNDSVVNYHLFKLADDDWLFVFAMHHLVLDAVANIQQILTVVPNYEKRMQNPSVAVEHADDLEALGIQVKEDVYPAFIQHDRLSTDSFEITQYWRDKFSNVEPLDYKVLNPVDEVVRKELTLNDDLWGGIRKYCRKQKITPALYFKCVLALALKHYCRTDSDFVISDVGIGRPKGHAEGIGCYYQMIPFLCQNEALQSGSTIAGLFQSAKAQQKDQKAQQPLSLFQQFRLAPQGRLGVMFNFMSFYQELSIMDIEEPVRQVIPDVDSSIQIAVKVDGPKVHLCLDYNGKIFEDRDLLERLALISEQIVGVNADNPKESIGELALITEKETSELAQWAYGDKLEVKQQLVHQSFEQQAAENPANVAVKCNDITLTYAELNEQANQLAHHLQSQGVKEGSPVAVWLGRSANWIVSVLAVIKAGGCYIPLDIGYPIARVNDVIMDAEARVIISEVERAEGVELPEICMPVLIDQLDLHAFSHSNIEPSDKSEAGANEKPLYIIYTSGSTGKPKGASVTHGNEENLLSWYTEEYDITAESQHLIISSPGFEWLKACKSN